MFAKYKRQLIFLVAVLFALGATFFVSFQNRIDIKASYDRTISTLKEAKWKFVLGKIEALRAQASDAAQHLSDEIRTEIISAYRKNGRNLSKDLANLDQDDHPVVNILGDLVPGRYLNGFQSDSDDPFVATREGIASDFSIDCSASGRTRTFEEEIALHHDEDLAAAAVSKLLDMDGGLIGWQFTQPENPKYTLPAFTYEELHDLFMKYGIDSLESFEFLVAKYIDEKSDLSGKPLVDSRGMLREASQLIVVQGFNIVKQLSHSRDAGATLTWYEEKWINAKNDANWTLTMYDLLLSFILVLMVMVYLIGMSQIERARDERA